MSKLVTSLLTAVMLISPTAAFAATGNFYIISNSATPAAQTVSIGQKNVNLFKFTVYARAEEGMKITNLNLSTTGTAAAYLENIRLIDVVTNAQIGSTLSSSQYSMNFSNLKYTLGKGEKRVFLIKADISQYAINGSSFKVNAVSGTSIGMNSQNAYTAKFSSTAGISSNTFTIGTGSQLIISKSPIQTLSTMPAGMDKKLIYFTMTSGADPVQVKKLNYTYSNTNSNELSVSTMRLRQVGNNNVLASFVPVTGVNSINFSGSSSIIIPANTTLEFVVSADISTPSAMTVFQFVINSAVAVDQINGNQFNSTGSASTGVITIQ